MWSTGFEWPQRISLGGTPNALAIRSRCCGLVVHWPATRCRTTVTSTDACSASCSIVRPRSSIHCLTVLAVMQGTSYTTNECPNWNITKYLTKGVGSRFPGESIKVVTDLSRRRCWQEDIAGKKDVWISSSCRHFLATILTH